MTKQLNVATLPVQEVITLLNRKKKERSLYAEEIPQLPVVLKSKRKIKGCTQPFYTNCITGKKSFSLNEVSEGKEIKILSQGSKIEKGYAFSYDQELSLVCLHMMGFDTHALKDGETRKWKEKYRLYVDYNKRLYSDFHYGLGFRWYEDYSDIQIIMHNLCPSQAVLFPYRQWDAWDFEIYLEKITQPVCRLFPCIFTREKTHYMNMTSLYNFQEFLRYREPVHKNGPQQRKLDSFVERGTSPVEAYRKKASETADRAEQEQASCEYSWQKVYTARFSAVERLDGPEPAVCIRTFIVRLSDKKYYEIFRMYFDQYGVTAGKITYKGDIINLPKYQEAEIWDTDLLSLSKDKIEGTVLEYFSEILSDIPENRKGSFAWGFADFPLFERLYKAGYKKTVQKVLTLMLEQKVTPRILSEEMFGTVDNSKKSLPATLGINKTQAEILFNDNSGYYATCCFPNNKDQYCFSSRQLLLTIKCIMTGTNLYSPQNDLLTIDIYEAGKKKKISVAGMDCKRFQNVAETLKIISGLFLKTWEINDPTQELEFGTHQYGYLLGTYRHLRRYEITLLRGWSQATSVWGEEVTCSEKYCRQILDMFQRNVKKEKEYMPKDGEYYARDQIGAEISTYFDYTDLCKQIVSVSDGIRLDPYFSSEDELTALHDNAVGIFNIQKRRITEKDLSESILRIKPFAYSNEEYMVKVPDSPDEFLKEGRDLHHCVGTYLNRVIRGNTNVMFIRKMQEPDVPFFTVEISSSGTIEQIHGLLNRNLDTEPDLIPFIEEWERERKVKRYKSDKIR